MKIYLRLEAPYEWVKVNESNTGISGDNSRVESFGEVESLSDYSLSDVDEVIGVISGDWITTHIVELPAKTKKLFNAALPYALEESISEDVENMHFIVPDWKAGQPCQVLAVSKDKIKQWQSVANEYNLPITQLIPDHSLVPLHDGAECTIALDKELIFAKKSDDYGVVVDKDFLDAWIMDVPVGLTIAVNDEKLTETLIADNPNRDFRHWACGSKLVHWLEYPNEINIDLYGDQYRPSVRRSGGNPYFLALLILFMVVVGKMAVDSYQYLALKSEISTIKKETSIAFKSALPDFGEFGQGKERSLMEKVLSRSKSDDSPLNLQAMLGAITSAIRGQNITVSEFSFQNDELLITCILTDFSQVDKLIKKINNNSRLTANLQSSETDEDKVIASYLVKSKGR